MSKFSGCGDLCLPAVVVRSHTQPSFFHWEVSDQSCSLTMLSRDVASVSWVQTPGVGGCSTELQQVVLAGCSPKCTSRDKEGERNTSSNKQNGDPISQQELWSKKSHRRSLWNFDSLERSPNPLRWRETGSVPSPCRTHL